MLRSWFVIYCDVYNDIHALNLAFSCILHCIANKLLDYHPKNLIK